MFDAVAGAVDRFHETIDPEYRRQKEEAKEMLQTIGLISIAVLVGSVALTIFGMALIASGGGAAGAGYHLIMTSLPIAYLAFNINKVSENLNTMADTPKKYINVFKQALDQDKVMRKLKEGTFCFGWVLDIAAECLARMDRQRSSY